MTDDRARFEAMCRLLYGPDDWRARSAAALGVSLRNLQYWTAVPPAVTKDPPAGVMRDLESELRQRASTPEGLAAIEAQIDLLWRRWLAATDALVDNIGAPKIPAETSGRERV